MTTAIEAARRLVRGGRRRQDRRVVPATAGPVARLFGSAAAGTAPRTATWTWRSSGSPTATSWRLVDALTVITDFDRIDVAVLNGAGSDPACPRPHGRGLYEDERGAFAVAQMAALAEWRDRLAPTLDLDGWRSDSPPRRAGRRVAHGSGSWRILRDLQLLADRTAADRPARRFERAAAERLVQVVVDLAVDVNSHLVVASGAPAPESGRESFLAAAAIGLSPPIWPAPGPVGRDARPARPPVRRCPVDRGRRDRRDTGRLSGSIRAVSAYSGARR